MGKKGGIKHQKRLSSPGVWPISRKESKWAPKTSPGPHPIKESFPLVIIVRDILRIVRTGREMNYILSEGNVKVDGKIRRDQRFPVGLMDVIQLDAINKYYRIFPSINKLLQLEEISKEESSYKLCKIEGKTTLKNSILQLNLHDGRNIRIPSSSDGTQSEPVYKTGDVLKLELPSQKILEHYSFQEGIEAVVIGGKNIGRKGMLTEIRRNYGPHASVATLTETNGTKFETGLEYVFPIKASPNQQPTANPEQ